MGVYSDATFTGTDGTNLTGYTGEDGNAWTQHPAWTADLSISGNRFRTSSAGNGAAIYLNAGVPASADYAVALDVMKKSDVSSQYLGLVSRSHATESRHYLALHDADSWKLYGVLGVSYSLLANVSHTLTVDVSARMVVDHVANRVRLWADGYEIHDSSSFTDAAAAGFAGVIGSVAGSDSTGLFGDNYVRAVPLRVGFIGDSIVGGHGLGGVLPGAVCCNEFETEAYPIGLATTYAVSGSQTADWISESSNLVAAKEAFAADGVTHVMITIGVNDSSASYAVSAATYKSRLQSCVDDLVGDGFTVILNYPTGYDAAVSSGIGYGATELTRMQTYFAAIDELCNGNTIRQGDTAAFAHLQANKSKFAADGVHLDADGNADVAGYWRAALVEALIPPTTGGMHLIGGGFFGRGRGFN